MNEDSSYVLPLYHCFDRLRDNEFPLGIDDYEKLLTVLKADFGISVKDYKIILDDLYSGNALNEKLNLYPKDYLLRLCKLLWLKPNQNVRLFEDIFEETYPSDFEYLGIVDNGTKNNDKEENLTNRNIEFENKEKKGPDTQQQNLSKTKQGERDNFHSNRIPVRIGISKYNATDFSIEQTKNTELEQSKFLFSENYYPIDNRKMQQNLKKLPLFRNEISSMEVDVNATINKTIEKGFFNEVMFTKHKKNVTNILLLIDHEGSMVAFDQLSRNIHLQIRAVLLPRKKIKITSLTTFYFYNIWNEHLYKNKTHTQYQSFSRVIKSIGTRQLNIIVFSDAGAAKGTLNKARIDETITALQQIKNYTNKLVWLNPMPEERWKDTSAQEISKSVAMFEATENGIRNAVGLLNGSTNKCLKQF